MKHTAANVLSFVWGRASTVTRERSASFQHDRLKSPGLHCVLGGQMDSAPEGSAWVTVTSLRHRTLSELSDRF